MKKPYINMAVGLSLLASILAISGCGEPPAETIPGQPVQGKLTINGKEPGTYAAVDFVSVDNSNETGSGTVDPTGRFTARAPLGKCKVAIRVGASQGGLKSNPGGSNYMKGGGGPTGPPPGVGGSGGPGGGQSGPAAMKGADIPKKFTDLKTSGVIVDVVAGQELNIDFK